MSLKLGLLGAGIQSSRMPTLQKYLADLSGVSLTYELLDSASNANFVLMQQLQDVIGQGFHGINVTHPFKQRVHPVVSQSLVPDQSQIGSYNTLLFKNNEIVGANTDHSGFIRGYKNRFSNSDPGTVLLCGAGGVGRAIAFSLVQLGVVKFYIFDIVASQADSLCKTLETLGVSAIAIAEKDLLEVMVSVDGLSNCTALGMHKQPGSAFPEQAIGNQSWVFDAVYTPLETEFILRCKKAGLPCLTGFDLWLFQGVDAFNIFTGAHIDVDQALIQTAFGWLD